MDIKIIKEEKRSGRLKLFGQVVIFFVIFALIVSMVSPSVTVSAEEDDEVEVPEWYEEDKWVYRMREPVYEGMTFVSEIERKVADVNTRFNVDVENGDDVSYDTYQIDERWFQEVEEEEDETQEINAKNYYTKDTLSTTFTHPVGGVASFYYPPVVEMDFPLSIGDSWTEEECWFFEETGADNEEPVREVRYAGEVKEWVTKEVEAGEFETLMINLTIIGRNLDTGDVEEKRHELYYAPEVKNVIHRQMYQTMLVPDSDETKEQPIGNETLISFDLQEPPENDEDVPFLGIGPLVFIVSGSAVIYLFKKRFGKWRDRQS